MVDAFRIPQEKKKKREKGMQSPKLSPQKAIQYKMRDYQVKHGYQRKWCSNYHRLKIMWKISPGTLIYGNATQMTNAQRIWLK